MGTGSFKVDLHYEITIQRRLVYAIN